RSVDGPDRNGDAKLCSRELNPGLAGDEWEVIIVHDCSSRLRLREVCLMCEKLGRKHDRQQSAFFWRFCPSYAVLLAFALHGSKIHAVVNSNCAHDGFLQGLLR